MISCVNDFNLYSCDEIENYNFDSARVYMGKREVANESVDIIEFIITNNEKKKLVITGGMYHKETGQLEFSEVIMKSNNCLLYTSSPLIKKAGVLGSATATNNDLTDTMKKYERKIKDMEKAFSTREQQLYSKWAKVETLMNQLNSQQSYLSSFMGS